MTLLRGYADDMALEPWLQEKIWPFEANLKTEDVILGTELAALEMLRGGTTCCADMYFSYEQGAQVFIDSGMRACPGGVLLGFLPNADERLNNAIAFARDWQNLRATGALCRFSRRIRCIRAMRHNGKNLSVRRANTI